MERQTVLGQNLSRASYAGALTAWTGFMLPSAIALMLFAYGVEALGGATASGWLQGLKVAAVAVMAQSVLGMMRSLASRVGRRSQREPEGTERCR